MAPQLIYLALNCVGLGVAMCQHGKETKSNFWVSLCSTVLGCALLWWGGFFDPMFK